MSSISTSENGAPMSLNAKWLRETIERVGEAPTDDPVDRLRHVVRVFEDSAADDRVITATSNVYHEPHWTGLTHGDLRAILNALSEAGVAEAGA